MVSTVLPYNDVHSRPKKGAYKGESGRVAEEDKDTETIILFTTKLCAVFGQITAKITTCT